MLNTIEKTTPLIKLKTSCNRLASTLRMMIELDPNTYINERQRYIYNTAYYCLTFIPEVNTTEMRPMVNVYLYGEKFWSISCNFDMSNIKITHHHPVLEDQVFNHISDLKLEWTVMYRVAVDYYLKTFAVDQSAAVKKTMSEASYLC